MELSQISVNRIKPNAYNPNVMGESGFAELVAEVRHLGRLPKPVIVRQNCDGFEIIDGEHGWRAAKECRLEKVPCEVIEVDDFEAMRQTYKRNQHGDHHPVLEGRMFKAMMAERSLSIRKLAKEIEVSEGTIRNALLWADAAELRNGYAPHGSDDRFDGLGIRDIRFLLKVGLPPSLWDTWIVAGKRRFQQHPFSFYKHVFDQCRDLNLLNLFAMKGVTGSNIESMHEALDTWLADDPKWHKVFHGITASEDITPHLQDPFRIFGECLTFKNFEITDDGPTVEWLYEPEELLEVLRRIAPNASGDDCKIIERVGVWTDLKRRNAGLEVEEDPTNPFLIEFKTEIANAPAFIKDSESLKTPEKLQLYHDYKSLAEDFGGDVACKLIREAIDLKKQRECELIGHAFMEQAQQSGMTDETIVTFWDDKADDEFKVDIDDIIVEVLSRHDEDESRKTCNRLFSDKAAVLEKLNEYFQRLDVLGELHVDGRKKLDILMQRIAMISESELALFAGLILGDQRAAHRWCKAVCPDEDIEHQTKKGHTEA